MFLNIFHRHKLAFFLFLLSILSFVYLILADKTWNLHSEVWDLLKNRSRLNSLDLFYYTSWFLVLINVLVLPIFAFLLLKFDKKEKKILKSNARKFNVEYRNKLIFCVVISLTALIFKIKPANNGLWSDEIWNVQNVLVGKTLEERDAEYDCFKKDKKFVQRDWKDVLFFFKKPTNHVLNNILVKTCLVNSEKINKNFKKNYFELLLRLPSLLAIFLSVLFFASILLSIFNSYYTLIPITLYALNPWLTWQSINSRSYSLSILLVTICLYLIHKLIINNYKWQDFLLLAICQILLLYNSTTNSILLVCLNLFLVFKIIHTIEFKFIIRYFIILYISAITYLFLMLPNILQSLFWQEHPFQKMGLTPILDTLFLFTLGIKWQSKIGGSTISFLEFFNNYTFLSIILLLALCYIILMHIILFKNKVSKIHFNKSSKLYIQLSAITLVATILPLVIIFILQKYYYPRFIIYGILLFYFYLTILLKVSINKLNRNILVISQVIILLFYLHSNYFYYKYPFDAMKNASVFYQDYKSSKDINNDLQICIGFDVKVYKHYFKQSQHANSLHEFNCLMNYAKSKKKDLSIILAHLPFNSTKMPLLINKITKSDNFILIKKIKSLNVENDVYIYRFNKN